EQLGQANVAVWPGVPLGQDDQRPWLVLRRRKPPGVDNIVLWIRRRNRAGKPQAAILKVVLPNRFISVKLVRIGHGLVHKARHRDGLNKQKAARNGPRPRQKAPPGGRITRHWHPQDRMGIRCEPATRFPIQTGAPRGWYHGPPVFAPSGQSNGRRIPSWVGND